jgi:diguanylate cyclase (GGDEF)-like protein/PAS domain S-box-containing protein
MSEKPILNSSQTSTEAPELANIGRRMALGFSSVVLVLMIITAIAGSLFYSSINNDNQRELEKTITELLAHSINRISFSGKYHARLLIEQITLSQPNIVFITILDLEGKVIAQSNPTYDIKKNNPFYERTMDDVLNQHSTVINDKELNLLPIHEVAMPYRSGYEDKIQGVIFVGISKAQAKQLETQTHWTIALIIVFLTLISLLITYLLSKRYAAPAISQAWQFKRILEEAPLVLFIKDKTGEIKNSSTMFSTLPEEGASIIDEALSSSAIDEQSVEKEVNCTIDNDQHTFWATRFPVLNHSDGSPSLICSIAMDITELKLAERALTTSEHRFRTLYNDNPLMLITVDKDQKINSINQFGCEHLGYSKEELIGISVCELYAEEDREQAKQNFNKCFQAPYLVHKWELKRYLKLGGVISVHETARVIYDVKNEPMALIVCEDITVRKQTEEKLTYHASHDMLTGLINRREFEHRVQSLLDEEQGEEVQHALCYLDLDQFKVVNDTSGHVAGDELLKQLSARLSQSVRRHDTIARLGGDEFGVLFENCNLDDAFRLAETLLNTIHEFQFAWENTLHRVGASIGLVCISSNTRNLTELLKEADAACYVAKDTGRNRIHIYQPDDTQISERHGEMLWVNRIQHALEMDRFCLFAQEILSLDEEHASHYELLVRMLDDTGNPVPPGHFLPAAERFNLITDIDYWVIDAAFSALNKNPNFVSSITFVSINISGPSLAKKGFHSFVERKLADYHIPANKICFEITETAAITNLQNANQFITQMKQLGCQFALDDFGSGLSSFGYLKQLPVEYLKIDGIFVKDIDSDPIDLEMVKSINQIGHVMGMKTIAEFVENDAIKSTLQELGVNYAQGYGIAKPIPLEQCF